MIHILFLIILALPLTACAMNYHAVDNTMMVQKEPATAPAEEQSFALMAEENGVTPCPRFVNNLNAAEQIVDLQPKNYPSML